MTIRWSVIYLRGKRRKKQIELLFPGEANKVFCMNDQCIYNYQDACMGYVSQEHDEEAKRTPYNLINDKGQCKAFKDGIHPANIDAEYDFNETKLGER